MVLTRYIATIVLAGMAATAAAQTQLIVVADHGGESTRPYFVAISGADVAENEGYKARAEAAPRAPVREADMLPVRTRRLIPGAVAPRSLKLPASTTPFFLIGTDSLSRRWLKQRGPRLRQLHAVGLVVDVESAAQLAQLRELGDSLVMRPVIGDDIARRLDLAHYPVLITAKGVQQ